jgi:hypothetical protein
VFALFCLYLSTYVVEGALRYALFSIGRPNLIYFRDLIAVCSVAFLFCRALFLQRQLDAPITVTACVLFAHACIGFAQGLDFYQIAFGVKVFLSLLYGVALWPVVCSRTKTLYVVIWLFFVVNAIGIAINWYLGSMPWEGQLYDTAFGAVTTTREWWADGVRRLPGVARASYDAALMAGLCGIAIVASSTRLFIRIFVSAIAMSVIVLTTTKGMILALSIGTIWLLLPRSSANLRLGRLIVFALLFTTCALPTLVVLYDWGAEFSSAQIPGFMSSLWERFQDMWPHAFKILSSPLHILVGAGIGAIGIPQTISTSFVELNAADNVFIYYLVDFGLLGVLYLAFPALVSARVCIKERPPIGYVYLGLLIIAYGYGMTTNMAEEPFFSVFFGLAYGLAFSQITFGLPRAWRSTP